MYDSTMTSVSKIFLIAIVLQNDKHTVRDFYRVFPTPFIK
jgi:hypothetical protein